MGQADIAKLLEQNYPKWLSVKDIFSMIDLSRNSVYRSTKCLAKCNEVEVKTEIIFNSEQKQVTYYRINKNVR